MRRQVAALQACAAHHPPSPNDHLDGAFPIAQPSPFGPTSRRIGFSLMEVLLALSILLACLTVLGQMAMVGRKHAEDAEQLTSAQLIGRSQLSAILAGAAPLASRTPAELAELPGWCCRVDVETLGEHGLVAVRVTVSKGPGEAADGAAVRPGKQFTLVRWMYAPEEGAGEPPAEPAEPAAPLGVVGGGP